MIIEEDLVRFTNQETMESVSFRSDEITNDTQSTSILPHFLE